MSEIHSAQAILITIKAEKGPGGGGGGGGEGALPINELMGVCLRMGSHFHDWVDYNVVAFSTVSRDRVANCWDFGVVAYSRIREINDECLKHTRGCFSSILRVAFPRQNKWRKCVLIRTRYHAKVTLDFRNHGRNAGLSSDIQSCWLYDNNKTTQCNSSG